MILYYNIILLYIILDCIIILHYVNCSVSRFVRTSERLSLSVYCPFNICLNKTTICLRTISYGHRYKFDVHASGVSPSFPIGLERLSKTAYHVRILLHLLLKELETKRSVKY